MTKDKVKALRTARAQAVYIRRLQQSLARCRGEDRALLEERLRREKRRMAALDGRARAALDGLRPEVYAFCVQYYVEGRSVAETSGVIDRGIRQCMRYKKIIETVEE